MDSPFSGFKKILVAVDSSDSAAEVFQKSLDLAKTHNTSLMIFHCLQIDKIEAMDLAPITDLGLYGTDVSVEMIELNQKLRQQAEENLTNWLQDLANQATSVGIPTVFDYKIGQPGPEICRVAKNWDADLIVVGRRGRSGLSELLLGSVSNHVLHSSHCSVLVIQH